MPKAIQNDPHMPCIAVAMPSRARKPHMPARNCASPPKTAANGNMYTSEVALPYQPARLAATMKVAPAKPNRPRIDGAAIGCRNTRVCDRQAAGSSGEIAPLLVGRWVAGMVLMEVSFLLLDCYCTARRPPALTVRGGSASPR